jgi:D-alanine transaminase
MPRQAYVNGRYVPHRAAAVHIEDRGYQFADGVYEVVPVVRGILVDEGPHLDRLERSLSELRIAMPTSRAVLKLISQELMRRNGLSNGFVYMQVTRGVSKPQSAELLAQGIAVITIPDQRWERCDIKSVSLLPNVLGKQEAVEAEAQEAWMVDRDGMITEGTSTNAWIVTEDNRLVTRDTSNAILGGITRMSLLALVHAEGVDVEERPFSREEVQSAREAFLTSSTNFVMPVTRIDGKPVGNGHPGLLTGKLRDYYMGYVEDLKDVG